MYFLIAAHVLKHIAFATCTSLMPEYSRLYSCLDGLTTWALVLHLLKFVANMNGMLPLAWSGRGTICASGPQCHMASTCTAVCQDLDLRCDKVTARCNQQKQPVVRRLPAAVTYIACIMHACPALKRCQRSIHSQIDLLP